MRAKLLSIEIDLEDIECSINILNASIEHAELSVQCFYDNLETLKANSIIASLEQFRMTSRQLNEAKKKLSNMKNKRNILNKQLAKKEKNREYYEKRLNEALDERELLREIDTVVDISDFRRKK